MPIKTTLVILATMGLLIAGPANAQNFQQNDPPDPEELLLEQLSVPYYGFTDGGLKRAQREQIRMPARALNEYRHLVTYSYFKTVGKIVTNFDDMTLYTSRNDRVFQRSDADAVALETHVPIIVEKDKQFHGLFGKAYNPVLDKWVLTLADKPLYRFTGDTKPGDTNGSGKGWDVIEVVG